MTCSGPRPLPSPPPTGRRQIRWPVLGVLLGLLLPLMLPAGTETATVRHVVDGDTVILSDQRQVRLIGINTPEFGRDGAPDQPLAAEARDRLRALVEGRPVQLQFEEEQRDRYGRWLAHLALADGRPIEAILIKEGLAFVIAIPPNLRATVRLQAAETEARRARRGVWGHPYHAVIAAEALAGETGFRRVQGRVARVGKSRKFVYLDLGQRLALRIGHHDWERYFRGRPEDWRGARLEARGWISQYNERLYMSIGHPAMLERLPD